MPDPIAGSHLCISKLGQRERATLASNDRPRIVVVVNAGARLPWRRTSLHPRVLREPIALPLPVRTCVCVCVCVCDVLVHACARVQH